MPCSSVFVFKLPTSTFQTWHFGWRSTVTESDLDGAKPVTVAGRESVGVEESVLGC